MTTSAMIEEAIEDCCCRSAEAGIKESKEAVVLLSTEAFQILGYLDPDMFVNPFLDGVAVAYFPRGI